MYVCIYLYVYVKNAITTILIETRFFNKMVELLQKFVYQLFLRKIRESTNGLFY